MGGREEGRDREGRKEGGGGRERERERERQGRGRDELLTHTVYIMIWLLL